MTDRLAAIKAYYADGTTRAGQADVLWLVAECERLWSEFDRLRQERADALSVTTKEGLGASEWILRTGKAERERDVARAEVNRLRALHAYGCDCSVEEACRWMAERDAVCVEMDALRLDYQAERDARHRTEKERDTAFAKCDDLEELRLYWKERAKSARLEARLLREIMSASLRVECTAECRSAVKCEEDNQQKCAACGVRDVCDKEVDDDDV